MGVFGAFFACIGVVGFNGCCSGASIGDSGFTLACISGCRGVVGFTVPPQCIVRAKKFALRGLVVGVSAKKFAQRTKNGPKWRFLACWAEFFAEMPLEGLCWASFFAIQQPQVPVGELCRAVALAAGPLLAVLTLRCAATPYGWHGGQPARATTHRVNLRMKGPRPPAVGSSVAAGCARLHAARRVYVRRLGVARKRSGVMCGWLCSRVRTGAPRPNPGGALPQPTIRRSAVPPEWRT